MCLSRARGEIQQSTECHIQIKQCASLVVVVLWEKKNQKLGQEDELRRLSQARTFRTLSNLSEKKTVNKH